MLTAEEIIKKNISINSIEDKTITSMIHYEALEWYLLSLGWKKYEANPNPDLIIFIKDNLLGNKQCKIELIKNSNEYYLSSNKIITIIKNISQAEGKSELSILLNLANASEMFLSRKVLY